MHLLAISGLHIGLLALLSYAILNWLLGRSQWLLLHSHVPTLALVLSFPLLLFYAWIAGMNTPVLRALIMASLLLAAVLVRRQHTIIHLISAAALLILIVQPLALFTVSFQLSFAAIVAIALIAPQLSALSFPAKRTDNKKYPNLLARRTLAAFLVSLAATAGTLPLLLYHFNRFSPIGPFMKLLMDPLLCFIALPSGLAAISIAGVFPNVAAFLLHSGGLALHLAVALSKGASQLPLASIWTITPSPGEIFCYYFLGGCLLLTGKTRGQKILLLAGAGTLIFHFTTDGLPFLFPKKQAVISFLDVGQGTATLLELPDGANILIDGGGPNSTSFNVGRKIIAPFLWYKRIRRLTMLIITHPDSDHFNGLPFISRHFLPGVVYINGQAGDANGYQELLKLLAEQQIPIHQARAGEILLNNDSGELTCLGMPGLATGNMAENDHSLVVRLHYGETSFLFPGDIEQPAEALLVRSGHLKSDVLLAPHHGSKTSSSTDFIKAVSPQLIVVSAGRARKNRYPSPAHRAQWQQKNIKVLITWRDGTIQCRTNGKTISCAAQ